MSMATEFAVATPFIVEDDRARLSLKAKTPLGLLNGIFKRCIRYVLTLRRAQAQGEQMLLALSAAADRIGFPKRSEKVGCDKAPNLMHLNALVLAFHQMAGKVSCSATLIAYQDHQLA
jgi:hypothetical protein